MNIHGLDEEPRESLIIFVHGLGGGGYETWKKFPSILLATFGAEADVGVFDYTSGIRRFRTTKDSEMIDVERELADEIKNLKYKRIILLGHSMGGLVSIRALRELYLRSSLTQPTGPRFGVIFFATPRAGSLWTPWKAMALGKDLRYLKAHSTYATEATDFTFEHIDSNLHRLEGLQSRPHVPLFSARATRDRLVDEFSSSFGLPKKQCGAFRGSHTSLVKPTSANDRICEWTISRIHDILQSLRPAKRTRHSNSNGGVVVEFNNQAIRPEWREAFEDSRDAASEIESVSFVEAKHATERPVELLMRVVDADRVDARPEHNDLDYDNRRQHRDPRIHLRISSFGPNATTGQQKIFEKIGNGPDGSVRSIEATDSLHHLREFLHKWLVSVAREHRSLPYYSASDDLRSEEALERAQHLDTDGPDGSGMLFRGRP